MRSAEALLQIYDYFLTATEQLARAECRDVSRDRLLHTAPDIGRSKSQAKSEGAHAEAGHQQIEGGTRLSDD